MVRLGDGRQLKTKNLNFYNWDYYARRGQGMGTFIPDDKLEDLHRSMKQDIRMMYRDGTCGSKYPRKHQLVVLIVEYGS
jgi:hypothetical protein